MKFDDFKYLPEKAGVYFFYDLDDRLIYIGKSINIKKRVIQHFSRKDKKSIKIQSLTHKILFENTGNELIALLYESDLIKIHTPILNRAQRKSVYLYGLYLEEDSEYKALRIRKIDNKFQDITTFSSLHEAKDALFQITEKYQLCQKINGLYSSKTSCFQYQIKLCYGACIKKENPEQYNQRVEMFLDKNILKKFSAIIKLTGRNKNEIGLVQIENGIYKGFGFCKSNENPDNYSKFIINKPDNKDVRRILTRFLILNPNYINNLI